MYTHGEMLPAHAYPETEKICSFERVTSEQHGRTSRKNLHNVPGAFLFTTNCLMPVKPSYADRVFTTEVVSYPENRTH